MTGEAAKAHKVLVREKAKLSKLIRKVSVHVRLQTLYLLTF